MRKAEEALIQLNLVKARIFKEYSNHVKLSEGANNSAIKRKILAGLAIEERKALSNMVSFYQEKLFWGPAKKKKPEADMDKSNKKDGAKDETLVLASKRVRIMLKQKTPNPVQDKN